MEKVIPKEKLEKVCKIGQGHETCAFIVGVGKEGFICAKGNPSLEANIRKRLAKGTMNAQGDNCDGCCN